MRLDRFLTEMGVGSRSDVKKLIAKSRISVNGEICKDPARKVDETADEVACDGTRIVFEQFVYFMLNKPQGVISESRRRVKPDEAGNVQHNEYKADGTVLPTRHGAAHSGGISCTSDTVDDTAILSGDGGGRTLTCIDLIHEETHRDLFPVGRLDKDTEGLLLITDDGQLAHELLSPKKHVDKVYYVELKKPLSESDRVKVESGVDIGDDTPTLPAKIVMLPRPASMPVESEPEELPEATTMSTGSTISAPDGLSETFSSNVLEITIHEGRFHQIKRMFEAVDNKVTLLKRLKMGSLELDPLLAPGEYRRLTPAELSQLKG